MRLKTALKQFSHAGVLALFFCSSCGLLGDKDSKSKTTKLNQSTGCLDTLGPLLRSYLKGTVDANEWVQTWTCVDDTLQTFIQYVRGSSQNAFTQDDIKLLVSRFIITGKPITPEFISGLFAMKATLFGGSTELLTKAEVNQFRILTRFLKVRTVSLIPRFWNYHNAPTRANLDEFAADLSSFGNDLVGQLNVEGHQGVSKEIGRAHV